MEGDSNKNPNYYHRMLEEIKETRVYILNIDGHHLHKFDQMFYWQILNFPSEIIPIMDIIASQVYAEIISNVKGIEEKTSKFLNRLTFSLDNKIELTDSLYR